MKSADVKSVYSNMRSAPTGSVKLIDIGGAGSCRVFSVVWCPYTIGINSQPMIQIWSGEPSDGDSSIIYSDGAVRGAGASLSPSSPLLQFGQSPPHYFLSSKDVWVKGLSPGVNNVTLTYQMGG